MDETENPLRSEAAMFRIFLGVGLAALPVIIVGLIAGPLAGAITLVVVIAVATFVAIKRLRGGEPS